jgi:hypothetical protein
MSNFPLRDNQKLSSKGGQRIQGTKDKNNERQTIVDKKKLHKILL